MEFLLWLLFAIKDASFAPEFYFGKGMRNIFEDLMPGSVMNMTMVHSSMMPTINTNY